VLRLAYLALTTTFALIRLLPMSNRDKDVEILALRHQLAVLQRKAASPRSRRTTARCWPRSCTTSPPRGYGSSTS
jgi:hypothetical protein